MRATTKIGQRVESCVQWLRSIARPARTKASAVLPRHTAVRTAVLAALTAVPLVLTTQVSAGIFEDLSMMGPRFPKRDKENREGEILVKFKATTTTTERVLPDRKCRGTRSVTPGARRDAFAMSDVIHR